LLSRITGQPTRAWHRTSVARGRQPEADPLERYHDWLVVDKTRYLIQFHLGESTREKNELAAKITVLDHKAKRFLRPPNSRWDDVNKQLINVITFGYMGHILQAKALLKDAENTCRLHRQSIIRQQYLIGFMLGILVATVIGYILIFLLTRLQPELPINLLFSIFLFAGMGSMVSALTRLNSLSLRDDSNDFDIMLSGSIRPVVGVLVSLVAFLLLSIKAFKITIGDGETHQEFVFLLAAFLCGFSERFANDIVAHVPFSKRSVPGDTTSG
jgi:hypothetical protein